MKNLSYLLLLPILLISLSACEEDEDAPNQTGSGAMVAKVNGNPWRHNGGGGVMGGGVVHVAYNPSTGLLNIHGMRSDDEFNNSIELHLSVVKQTGDYALREKGNGNYARLFDNKERGNPKFYFTNTAQPGRVTITKIDPNNKIISGTFSFIAQREGENGATETVEVTDGWFDVKYR